MPRLSELLARNLGISKTAAVRLIEAGRVSNPNGDPYEDRRSAIDAGDGGSTTAAAPIVIVDGESVTLWQTAFVLLHKPIGVVTALRDTRHPTAYDLLRDAPLFPELRPAGRLDLDSSGLLLWTTEGALIQRLTHPKRRVPRTYQAALARSFQSPPLDFVLDDGHRPEISDLREMSSSDAHPGLAVPPDTKFFATITIIGGAYHEVRRIFAALGSHVLGLCRTRFGEHALPHDLPAGTWIRLPDPPST